MVKHNKKINDNNKKRMKRVTNFVDERTSDSVAYCICKGLSSKPLVTPPE
jgi:hypothetical protein